MIFKKSILFFAVIITCQGIAAQNFILNLYPEGKIPNYQKTDEKEIRDTSEIVRIRKVQIPDIAVFLPAERNRTGEAIVICPGGGYKALAYDWEGKDVAKYWNSKGVTAIVLKYRLPTSKSQKEPHLSPLLDAQRALRLVRYKASEWKVDPDKIGIMGFSAGGHLASTLSTHFDEGNPSAEDPVERVSCRPDFSMLIYPVISFTGEFTHSGSRTALLGNNPEPEMIKYYSNELQIDENTPPAILIHSSDDKAVPVENSIVYYKNLQKMDINAAMHIFPYGGHGYSLAIEKGYLSVWPELCHRWMKQLFEES